MIERDGEASEINSESYSVEIPKTGDSEYGSEKSCLGGIPTSRDSEFSHKHYRDERPKYRDSKSTDKHYRIEISICMRRSETKSQKKA
jgi:hypothetical protein